LLVKAVKFVLATTGEQHKQATGQYQLDKTRSHEKTFRINKCQVTGTSNRHTNSPSRTSRLATFPSCSQRGGGISCRRADPWACGMA
jgi:hypothetical protein